MAHEPKTVPHTRDSVDRGSIETQIMAFAMDASIIAIVYRVWK